MDFGQILFLLTILSLLSFCIFLYLRIKKSFGHITVEKIQNNSKEYKEENEDLKSIERRLEKKFFVKDEIQALKAEMKIIHQILERIELRGKMGFEEISSSDKEKEFVMEATIFKEEENLSTENNMKNSASDIMARPDNQNSEEEAHVTPLKKVYSRPA